MKKLLSIFLVIITLKLFSIETIEAPFISKLTFEVANKKILLKWQNPNNFDQNLTIYRFNDVIDSTQKIQAAQKIATLKNQEERYIDTTPTFGSYYYAVLITNKSSNENYQVLVPYRNYTQKPAVTLMADYYEITKFSASVQKKSISLEWNYTTESKTPIKIMLYRNTLPIKDEQILGSSIKIASVDIDTKVYIDVPISNIAYYYAIFIEGEIDKKFIPGINITIDPVSIEMKTQLFPDFSIENFIPLPLLAIKNDPKSGKYFLDPQILKSPKKTEYNEKVKAIMDNYRLKHKDSFEEFMKLDQNKFQQLNFHILNNEEIYEPKEFINEYKNALLYIKQKQYAVSLAILEEGIKEMLPEDLLYRVSYYIGLIYYTKGDYYMAYVYLILACDTYRSEVLPYLESIYQKIFIQLER